MAESVDLSRVIALTNKGMALSMKGREARAAEKFALAAEEAERVLCGSPDCIVIAALRNMQAEALLSHSNEPTALPADSNNAWRKACDLLPTVMEMLQRRKAAGTLLPGACQAVEVAWFTAETRHNLMLHGHSWLLAEAEAAFRAPHAGLETFMRVASAVACVLLRNMERTLELSDKATATDYHGQAPMLFLTSALELMMLPRPQFELWIAGEPELVRFMRMLSPLLCRGTHHAGDVPQQLHKQWRRLLRSGILRTREIEDGIKVSQQRRMSLRADAAAALAAGRLRSCGLASCAGREAHEAQYGRCAACKTVVYCCREHQLADWPAHKAACKAARKKELAADAP